MKFRSFVTVLAALVALLVSKQALATHFRYGNITYSIPDQAAPLTVRFEVTTAWRADFVGDSALDFGDGAVNPATTGFQIGSGTDAAGLNYKVQRYIVTHTYAAAGQYTAFFTSCCRISNLVNAGDDSFRVEAKVDLTPGNKGNAVAALPAVIQLQTGGVRTIPIPTVDPDGVPISCLFATQAQSLITTNPPIIPGGGAPTLAPAANGCTLTWNTATGVAGQQYAISVVVESFNGPNKATAFLDFIVEFVASPPPTCSGGGTFTVDVGQTFNGTVVGTNVAAGNLTMTTIGLFGSTTPFSGTTQPSPFSVDWTVLPGQFDPPVNQLTIVYKNAQNASGFCTVTIVSAPCPEYGTACAAGVGECQATGFLECIGGNVTCNAVAGMPTPEVCDGKDNDCDGTADQGDPGGGQLCSSGLPGVCDAGTSACTGGALTCTPNVLPGVLSETCNGADDDCNGVDDDGFGVGLPCTEGEGTCNTQGFVVCDGQGATTCSANPGVPEPEKCDGLDNDCDGDADEDFPLGDACTSGEGACQTAGVVICDAAKVASTCSATPGQPGVEVCGNDVDEDCDGALDNGCVDSDDDGLFDEVEVAIGTDPDDADSDDDGVLDGDEPDPGGDADGDLLVNALDPDSDNDGLFDGTELGLGCDGPGTDATKGHCRADADQGATKTDPLVADTDGGGATDGSEDANLDGKVDASEGDPNANSDDGSVVDTDGDGLSDALEAFLGSDPDDADSDDDGASDGLEANPSDDTDGDGLVNVLDVDSDDDALFDGTELGLPCNGIGTDTTKKHCIPDQDQGSTKTSPVDRDTDGGGATDGSEDANLNGIADTGDNDPTDDAGIVDSDGDGLGDELEAHLGSDPDDVDSDNDGLLDGAEKNPADDRDGDGKLDVLDADSDGDGLFDGLEAGMDCNNPDTGGSDTCTPDADEGATKTGVLQPDTDGGGATDGDEDANKNGVVDEGERDPNDPADDGAGPACTDDASCGAGKVCDAAQGVCIEGCRNGTGCPAGEACTSSNDSVGQCVASGPADVAPAEDSGCGCRTVSTTDGDDAGLLALIGVAALLTRRRRRS